MALDIDALLRETAERHALPSIVLGISRYGQLVSTHAVGRLAQDDERVPDADSVYRIASMTKSFTAAAVLLLRDRGALHLDQSVRHHLPWFDEAATTLRDLLTMNGGFPTDDPWGDRHESTELAAFDALIAAGVRRIRAPRQGFEYSNLGYALLGRVITAASGCEYTEFVAHELLQPLGMVSSTFDHRRVPTDRAAIGYQTAPDGIRAEPAALPGAFSPMGGLHSTVRDLTTWMSGFLDALGPADMAHPLAASSRRDQQQPHTFARLITRTEPMPSASSLAYGYGLLVEDHSTLGRFVHHAGGYPGFGSNMRWHPRSGWAVVVLSNRTYAPIYAMAETVITTLVSDEPQQPADLWPETAAAMQVAEALLRAWDDDVADAAFAHNLDADQPRAERRSAVAAIAASMGPFSRDDTSISSRTPAHVRWRVVGADRGTWIEVLMSPDPRPRVQTLRFEPDEE